MSWWLQQTCSAQYQVRCSCPGSTVGQLQRRRQPCELALLTCTTLSESAYQLSHAVGGPKGVAVSWLCCFCNAAEKPLSAVRSCSRCLRLAFLSQSVGHPGQPSWQHKAENCCCVLHGMHIVSLDKGNALRCAALLLLHQGTSQAALTAGVPGAGSAWTTPTRPAAPSSTAAADNAKCLPGSPVVMLPWSTCTLTDAHSVIGQLTYCCKQFWTCHVILLCVCTASHCLDSLKLCWRSTAACRGIFKLQLLSDGNQDSKVSTKPRNIRVNLALRRYARRWPAPLFIFMQRKLDLR